MNHVSVTATGLWAKVQTGQYIAAGESESLRPSAELSNSTAKVINNLFRELRSIFPAWKQAWPDMATYKAAKQQWLLGFLEAGICSTEQLRFGLMQARQAAKDFVPNVGVFIGWCTPTAQMLGLPSLAVAHREACRNAHPSMAGQAQWSHDAVWHTAKECGFENLNRLAHDLSLKLFDRNYTITVRRVLAGLPLQKMPLALPPRPFERSAPEVGNRALAALRALRTGSSAHE